MSLGNASSEELEKFLMGSETETETETVGGVHEEKPTKPTIFDTDQVFLEALLLYFLMHYNMLNTQNTHMCQPIQSWVMWFVFPEKQRPCVFEMGLWKWAGLRYHFCG